MFEEEYNQMTRGDKNQFAKTLSNLLYECYIVRKVYNTKSKMFISNPDYIFIERHESLFEQYLDFAGITLSKAEDEGIYFVISDGEYNHMRLDSVTTLVVYALRDYYEDQVAKAPQTVDVSMDSRTLTAHINELGLSNLTKKLSATTIASCMRTLDSYNIVNRSENSYSDLYYSFYILPTIRFVISNEKMNALYREVSGEKEETNDNLFSNADVPFSNESN